jgi:hypothetical protein
MSNREILFWLVLFLVLRAAGLFVEDYATLDASDIINLTGLALLVIIIVRVAVKS